MKHIKKLFIAALSLAIVFTTLPSFAHGENLVSTCDHFAPERTNN